MRKILRYSLPLVLFASVLRGSIGPALATPGTTITVDGASMCYQRTSLTGGTTLNGSGATRSDFDGDGVDDIAVGMRLLGHPGDPRLDCDGGIVVRYASGRYVDYLLFPSGNAPSMAPGDFNGDGYDDLALGDAYETLPSDTVDGAGGVWIIPGGPDGLVPGSAQHLTQDSPGVPGVSEPGDRFGLSVAAGDLNGDGRDDLAIGAFGEAIGSLNAAGAATVLFGGPMGIRTVGAIGLNQGQAAVPGAAEADDWFGETVTIGKVNGDQYADLVVAAPNERTSARWATGMLTLFKGGPTGLSLTGVTSVTGRDVVGVSGVLNRLGVTVAVGDTNGDGFGEVLASTSDGLFVLAGRSGGLSSSGVRLFNQATPGVPGADEADDDFGGAIAVGDITGDGRADVVVGAPGEDVGTVKDAGAITLLKGSASGLTAAGSVSYSQQSAGVPGTAEANDRFGGALAILNLDGTGALDLVAGASGEQVGDDVAESPSGWVATFKGGSAGLTPMASWSGVTFDLPGADVVGYAMDIGPSTGLGN